jgi:hypothetical protein
MVEVGIIGRIDPECPKAYVIQRAIVQAHHCICIVYKLFHGQNSIIRFYHSIRNLHIMSLNRGINTAITFGDGNTEKVNTILSGYSSLNFDRISVPRPDPVPPPKECAI